MSRARRSGKRFTRHVVRFAKTVWGTIIYRTSHIEDRSKYRKGKQFNILL